MLAARNCGSPANPGSKRSGGPRWAMWKFGGRFAFGKRKVGWKVQTSSPKKAKLTTSGIYDLRNCAEIRVTLSPTGTGTVHVGES
jgi:hypothetical protein